MQSISEIRGTSTSTCAMMDDEDFDSYALASILSVALLGVAWYLVMMFAEYVW